MADGSVRSTTVIPPLYQAAAEPVSLVGQCVEDVRRAVLVLRLHAGDLEGAERGTGGCAVNQIWPCGPLPLLFGVRGRVA